MDSKFKKEIEELKSFSSKEAVTWLVNKYSIQNPEYGRAFQLISHRSWDKQDQIDLAMYYFNKLPFANSRPYEVFVTLMSIGSFIEVIFKKLPKEKPDIELLLYYLEPVLRGQAVNEKSQKRIDHFLSELRHNQ